MNTIHGLLLVAMGKLMLYEIEYESSNDYFILTHKQLKNFFQVEPKN